MARSNLVSVAVVEWVEVVELWWWLAVCVGLLGKKQEVWLLLSGLRTQSCGFREERERQGGT